MSERRHNQRVILERAKGLIEKYGWVQGKLGHVDIGYCLKGAVDRAEVLQSIGEESCMSPSAASVSAQDACYLLRRLANMRLIFNEDEGAIPVYNDTPGRTKGEILDLLDEAINDTYVRIMEG